MSVRLEHTTGFGEKAAFSGLAAEVDGTVVAYALYHDGYETEVAG